MFLICLFFLFLLLADILQANDNLTQVINRYRQLVKGEDVSTDGITLPSQPGMCVCEITKRDQITSQTDYKIAGVYPLSQTGSSSSALVDLMGLNASANATPSNPEPSSLQTLTQNTGISLLDDELMSLGKHKKNLLWQKYEA